MIETLNNHKQQVVDYIERTEDELVSFLSDYLRFRSINPDMLAEGETTELRECQEWLAQQLESWQAFDDVQLIGVDTEQPNVAARRKGSGGDADLLFNGHTDVVPVTSEQEENWTIGTPWGGEVIDGKIVGRGASDMKG